MSDWSISSGKPTHTRAPLPAASDEDLLDDIVAECVDGEHAQLATRISSACDAHPRLASAIRRRFESLREVGLLREPAAVDERFPERLGDFRLLERLGGGGMGVVFRARQQSLGRDVALKLIRPEHLYFQRARDRFQRETEAVARLQHPGIVPIYAVGDENGVPYFAMELLPAGTLAAALTELHTSAPERLGGRDLQAALQRVAPSWSRSIPPANAATFEGSYAEAVVGLTIQVADALEHAHSRDVLHRDVKPSNIAATPEGRALLFDFGLASFSAEALRMTATRTEIGSLPYMAPEQLRGGARAVGPRADVYALGVTLYELLALQLPYGDDDVLETRRAILEGRRDPLRARNRAVSRDLELVCAKAMELDASRRYASAGELADDLRNVLEHRPVRARTPNALVIASRWIRRHPATSTGIAASLCFVIGVPTALLVQKSAYADRLAKSLDDATAQRELAISARTEADEQRNLARDEAQEARTARDFLVKLFGDTDPAMRGGRELLARDLLDIGRQRLETWLDGQPLTRASLYLSIGDSYAGLGAWREAETALRRAVELSERHAGPESVNVAYALSSLSSLEREIGNPEALAHAERAVAILRAHSVRSVAFSDALIGYGLGLVDARRFDEAEQAYGEALTNLDQVAPDLLSLRACVLVNYANLEFARGDHVEALHLGRDALVTQREHSLLPHPALTSSLNIIAMSLCELRRLDEARAAFAELLELEPQVAGETARLATFLMNSTTPDRLESRFERVIPPLERACELYARVAPDGHDYALQCRDSLIDAYCRQSRWRDALERQTTLAQSLEARFGPAHERVLIARVRSALLHSFLGDADSADEHSRAAVEIAGELGAADDARWEAIAAAMQARSALTRGDSGRARELIALAQQRLADSPKGTPAWLWTTLASGELARAEGDGERAQREFASIVAFDAPTVLAAPVPALATLRQAELLATTDAERSLRLAETAREKLTTLVGAEHPDTRAAQALIDAL